MKSKIVIRFSALGKQNPKEWESSASIEGQGKDEDEAERDAIRKFKAEHGDIPYTVDQNIPMTATILHAATRLVATSIDDLNSKIKDQARKMDKVARTSPEYLRMQFEMQKLLRELRHLDPSGKNTPFDYLAWSHSGKPQRDNSNPLGDRRKGIYAETEDAYTEDVLIDRTEDGISTPLEDPLSTGTAFDTLIDGEPSAADPSVQTVTRDDGAIEEAPEQDLLRDDLVVPSIQFG